MLARHENHTTIRADRLCPLVVHYKSQAFQAVCGWHANLEIILALHGNGQIQYGAEVLEISSGDILVINPNILHRVYQSDDFFYHCIILDRDFCADNGVHTDQLLFARLFRCPATEALCKSVADRFARYYADRTPLNGAKTRSAALALLVELWEHHLSGPGDPCDREKYHPPAEDYVKKTARYLEAHYAQPVRLDALAQLCGISKCHLSREFKRYTGQTVLTYVNLFRCTLAQQHIADGMTVSEAALSCGFEGVSHFSRTYKKLMGEAPSKAKHTAGAMATAARER